MSGCDVSSHESNWVVHGFNHPKTSQVYVKLKLSKRSEHHHPACLKHLSCRSLVLLLLARYMVKWLDSRFGPNLPHLLHIPQLILHPVTVATTFRVSPRDEASIRQEGRKGIDRGIDLYIWSCRCCSP